MHPAGLFRGWHSRDITTLDKRDFIESIHIFLSTDGKYVTEVKVTATGRKFATGSPRSKTSRRCSAGN